MIDWTAYEAVFFDLDGVLTATARLHAASWKRMFDDYLRRRASAHGESFRPFEMPGDYARFVDGRPRYDGARTFLASRGITLADGGPADPPGVETVCGLGNRKNAMFGDLLASEGVEVYDGSLAVVRYLLRNGVRAAVVSSSRSCEALLRTAKIADLFELRVDGQVAAQGAWRASQRPTPSSTRRGCLAWRRRGLSSWRMPSPAWKPAVPGDSGLSSPSIAPARRRRSHERARTRW